MKRDNVDRHAVPENQLERFMGIVYSLLEPFGVSEVPEVCHYIDLLGQAIERQIAESKCNGSPQNKSTIERRKFISIFKNRYLHLTDLEYARAISPIDGRLINQLLKVLEENGFDVDEFLAWLFDDFLADNPKFCPPSVKFSCSSFVVEKFMFDNKDKIRQKREEKIRQKASLDLLERARILIRVFDHDEVTKKNIVAVLKEYRDGSIMLEKLREAIEALERVARENAESDGKMNQGASNGPV